MKKISLILTILLPLISIGIFDQSGLVAFATIPWLIVSIPSVFFILFIAKRCKISTTVSYTMLLILSVIISVSLGVNYYHQSTPKGRFYTYFHMNPLPSVQNLRVTGVVYVTGGHLDITFDVSPSDCDKLIAGIGFANVTEDDLENKAKFRAIQKDVYENIFPEQLIYIDSEYEGMSYRMLIVNEEKTKACFKRYRM